MNVKEIKECTNMHRIPKDVHINRGILFDYRLADALDNPTDKDYKYDFDVFLPKYGIKLQRKYVWKPYQQNEFILSVLLEKPISPFILVMHSDDTMNRDKSTFLVIDGKQRMMTIQKFLHNEFPIIVNGEEVYYKDFDDELKRYFRNRVNYLTADVYYSYESQPIDDDMKIILFNFYNFSGTPQTEKHKNKLQSLINHE